MANSFVLQDHKTNVSTTVPVLIDWSNEGGVQIVYITVKTADVFVAFDDVANTDSFRVIAGNQPAGFNFDSGTIKKISILASSGTNDVYVMGIKS